MKESSNDAALKGGHGKSPLIENRTSDLYLSWTQRDNINTLGSGALLTTRRPPQHIYQEVFTQAQ